jgi:WD40 repeat protein
MWEGAVVVTLPELTGTGRASTAPERSAERGAAGSPPPVRPTGPRPERVFAERLALLRREAGQPTFESIERGITLDLDPTARDRRGRPLRAPSYQRISAWVNGENLPSSWPQCELVLRVLIGRARATSPRPSVAGLYGLASWEALWKAARTPVAAPDVCPYRGLESFQPEHAELFFGRARATADLVRRVRAASDGLVMLVGPSGVGKSSLLRAGLVPALEREGWSSLVVTPAVGRGGLPPEPGSRLVLVVDQFEELFTAGYDERERAEFVRELVSASAGPATVVIGVRADFYGRCLAYPALVEALQERQMVLPPMTGAELTEAITAPARSVGLRLEPGLVDLLLRDAGGRAAGAQPAATNGVDAGALPLVSHALAAVWGKRHKGVLTIQAYREAGGIAGGVEASAERAWAHLDAAGQRVGPGLLLSLTRLGDEGAQDTRLRADKRRLLAQVGDRAAADTALEVLAGARLVTLDAESVQLAHEAVLHAWPRFRTLIDAHRGSLLLRQQVEQDASAWDVQRREPAQLYRGARLETAQRWADGVELDGRAEMDGPSQTARAFLGAGARQHRRQRLALGAVVAVVAVLALVTGIAAVAAVRQRDAAVFGEVVAKGDALRAVDPSASARLDLVAAGMRPDSRAVQGRLLSTQNSPLATPLPGAAGSIYTVSFGPDARTLVTGSERSSVVLWDLADPTRPTPLGAPLTSGTRFTSAAVFSPDGRTLVTADGDHSLRLWDVTDRAHPRPLGEPTAVPGGAASLSFSPDGRTLAGAGAGDVVRLWNIADPAHPVELGPPLPASSRYLPTVSFSPVGGLLAAGGSDGLVRLWNVTDPAHPRAAGTPFTDHPGQVESLAFTPDGHTLISGGDDKTVRLWNIADPGRPTPLGTPLPAGQGVVWSVRISPDGHTVAAGNGDGTARLWNIDDPGHPQQLGAGLPTSTGGIESVAFSPDGRHLATGGVDGNTMLWSLPRTLLAGHTAPVQAVAVSPDGHTLASGGMDNTVRLWDTARLAPLGPPTVLGGYVEAVTFSSDGRLLASAEAHGPVRLWSAAPGVDGRLTPLGEVAPKSVNCHGVAFAAGRPLLATCEDYNTVRLWDVIDAAHPQPLGTPLSGNGGNVNWTAFSPDGRLLATAGKDGTVRLWDVGDPATARPLGPPLDPAAGPLGRVVFSPDGRTLAAAGETETILLWNVTDPAGPVRLPSLAGQTQLVASLAFSPDSHTLAAGSVDRTTQLWDLTDPAHPTPEPRTITGHSGAVNGLAFDSAGATLVTGSDDNTIMLWDLEPKHAADRVCATTAGSVPELRWRQLLPDLSYAPPC